MLAAAALLALPLAAQIPPSPAEIAAYRGLHAAAQRGDLMEIERLAADRRTILAALRAENIGVTVHYVPVYWHPYYRARGYERGLCPNAEWAFEHLLTLPLFPAMSDEDVDDVLAAVRKVLGHYLR